MKILLLFCVTSVLVSCSALPSKKIESQSMPVIINSAAIDSVPKPALSETKTPIQTEESLKQRTAESEAKIRYSERATKIKHVRFISKYRYLVSQYTIDWAKKIERIGILNFPEVAKKEGFTASLLMEVGIMADGNIFSIHIPKSSGNQALDDAAKRIVRLAAPFAALPIELLNEVDVLVIPRLWEFRGE